MGQLKNLHKSCLATFKTEMLEGMRGEGYNFADVVAVTRERCEKRFLKGAQEALVEETEWNYEEELTLLKEEIKSVAGQCRKDETKKMVNLIEVRLPDHDRATRDSPVGGIAQFQEANIGACRGTPEQAGNGPVGQNPHSLPRHP